MNVGHTMHNAYTMSAIDGIIHLDREVKVELETISLQHNVKIQPGDISTIDKTLTALEQKSQLPNIEDPYIIIKLFSDMDKERNTTYLNTFLETTCHKTPDGYKPIYMSQSTLKNIYNYVVCLNAGIINWSTDCAFHELNFSLFKASICHIKLNSGFNPDVSFIYNSLFRK